MLWSRIRVVVTYLQKLLFENHFKAEALICERILANSRVVVIVKDVEYPLLLPSCCNRRKVALSDNRRSMCVSFDTHY